MCMKKRTIAIFILAAIAIYGAVRIVRFAWGYHMPLAYMPRHYGPFAPHHHFAFHHGPGFGFWESGGWITIEMFSLLFQLGLLLIGWLLWKTSGPSKWLGLAIIVWGVISLLPKWLLIPLAVIAIYSLYKKQERKAGPMAAWPTPVMHDRNFLDEWEKTIKKEEQ
ncbi:hypothetical protein BCV53_05290 [Parageobacillus thermoglucosidasius]|uniref:Uncharacterized protein n=2 Tax=Parageobacillus thermoglucosidasius TaxID=1426 RepID=A0AAN0YLV9_PARTM|nr:hypothetical protein AOT13_05280 [Parageobacillus thermoglucosidasius]ANZ29555.1 hypothetical protein BCV53_05290 [Parageobacillus thermoglucosidasius]APM80293.1 hypothetical protein BCV54_05295 [Parageobacillus thermoglucosidasius]KJX70166.1 hypothetical protein WH82_03050 [Parageobacillus thermoglucosidasius]RDE20867.1 hypothetical protein DV712_11785 [Parageobacillus thermoglucosidasius]